MVNHFDYLFFGLSLHCSHFFDFMLEDFFLFFKDSDFLPILRIRCLSAAFNPDPWPINIFGVLENPFDQLFDRFLYDLVEHILNFYMLAILQLEMLDVCSNSTISIFLFYRLKFTTD